jgi:hypothetical protein
MMRWRKYIVDGYSPDGSIAQDLYVTHETASGSAVFRVVKPTFQTLTPSGKTLAVFQTSDGRSHTRPFRTQTVWQAGPELLELSCEDQSIEALPYERLPHISTTSDGGEEQ